MRINQENKSMDMEARDINYILPAYIRSYLFYSNNELPEKIIFPMFPSVAVGDREIPIEYVPPLDPVAVEIANDGSAIPEVTSAQEAVLDEKDEEIKRLKAEVESLTTVERGEDEVGGTPTISIEHPLAAIDESETEEQTAARLKEEVGGEPLSPARTAFADEFGKAVDKTETERYEAEDERQQKIHQAIVVEPNRKPNQPPGGDIGPGLGLSDTHGRDRRDQARTARDLADEPDINEAEEKEFEKPISRDGNGRPVVEDKDK